MNDTFAGGGGGGDFPNFSDIEARAKKNVDRRNAVREILELVYDQGKIDQKYGGNYRDEEVDRFVDIITKLFKE